MNPIEKIKNALSGMTEGQRRVADFIIKNPFDVVFLTVDKIANKVRTSTTTVMRLMTYLGYSGYSQFQKEVQESFKDRISPKDRLEINLRDTKNDNLWKQCYEKQIKNIQNTFEQLQENTIENIAVKIKRAHKLYIVSARGGAPVAQYLSLFLSRILPNVIQIQSDDVTFWSTKVPDFSNKDVMIAISYPRYSKNIIKLTEEAKKKGIYIIGITDGYSSPISKSCDMLIPCSCGSLGFHNSPVSAMLLADCIINVTTLMFSSDSKKRLSESGRVLEEYGYYKI